SLVPLPSPTRPSSDLQAHFCRVARHPHIRHQADLEAATYAGAFQCGDNGLRAVEKSVLQFLRALDEVEVTVFRVPLAQHPGVPSRMKRSALATDHYGSHIQVVTEGEESFEHFPLALVVHGIVHFRSIETEHTDVADALALDTLF